jgi:hypothetical protein
VEEGEVVAGLAVAAGGDAAFRFQPGVGALDRPTVACLGIAGLWAALLPAPDLACWGAVRDRLAAASWLADARLDLPFAQRLFERGRGVAAVGPELARADAAGGERIDERQQVPLLVLVPGREPGLERRPARVDR